MRMLSLRMWRRVMSLVIALFGITLLALIVLLSTLVPPGTDPQTAGPALARDPRLVLGAVVLTGLFLVGLVLGGVRVAYFAYVTVTKSKHPTLERKPLAPRFSQCPICTENVPLGSLGRSFRNHLRIEHPGYWKRRRNWSVAITLALVAWIMLLFPFLITGIIPGARTGATTATFYGLGAFISVEVAVGVIGAWSSRSGTRR